jgi:hypothetical protein
MPTAIRHPGGPKHRISNQGEATEPVQLIVIVVGVCAVQMFVVVLCFGVTMQTMFGDHVLVGKVYVIEVDGVDEPGIVIANSCSGAGDDTPTLRLLGSGHA